MSLITLGRKDGTEESVIRMVVGSVEERYPKDISVLLLPHLVGETISGELVLDGEDRISSENEANDVFLFV